MKQPVLLCYNLSGEKMQKIRLAAMRLKIRVRPVEKDEYAQTVAALCGLEEKTDAAYVGAGFEDEILRLFRIGIRDIFANLFHRQLEHFPLICLFFLHNALDDRIGEQSVPICLVEPERLRIGRSAVVYITLL